MRAYAFGASFSVYAGYRCRSELKERSSNTTHTLPTSVVSSRRLNMTVSLRIQPFNF